MGPEGAAMNIGGEVGDAGGYSGIETGAEGEVPAEAHACCSDLAGAGRQGKEVVYGLARVFIVGR